MRWDDLQRNLIRTGFPNGALGLLGRVGRRHWPDPVAAPRSSGGTTQDPGFVSAANGGACEAGAAISNGTVFWGSGYRLFFTGNNKFYAFGLP